MENKYYTPTIEEFHVGFEYEWTSCKTIDWHKDKLEFIGGDSFINFYLSTEIRVKLLDREDIESTVFNYGSEIKESRSHIYYANVNDVRSGELKAYYLTISKVGWVLIYYTDNLRSDNTLENIVRFSGYVKNKSELQKLLIQLGIK